MVQLSSKISKNACIHSIDIQTIFCLSLYFYYFILQLRFIYIYIFFFFLNDRLVAFLPCSLYGDDMLKIFISDIEVGLL